MAGRRGMKPVSGCRESAATLGSRMITGSSGANTGVEAAFARGIRGVSGAAFPSFGAFAGGRLASRSFRSSGPPLREEDKTKKRKGIFHELGVIFSKEKQEERSRQLKEEVTRGQFFEVKELDKTGGKIFEADTQLIPMHDERCVTFPNVDGKTLTNQQTSTDDILGGKVSLVTVSLREIARPMVNSWTTHFHSKLGHNPNAQVELMPFRINEIQKHTRVRHLCS